MVEEPIIIKIMAWVSGLLPAILGSAISLKLASDNASIKSRIVSFFSGIIFAHYIGWAIVERFNISPESMSTSAILFVAGIFGITVAAEIYRLVPEFLKNLLDKLLSWVGKK